MGFITSVAKTAVKSAATVTALRGAAAATKHAIEHAAEKNNAEWLGAPVRLRVRDVSEKSLARGFTLDREDGTVLYKVSFPFVGGAKRCIVTAADGTEVGRIKRRRTLPSRWDTHKFKACAKGFGGRGGIIRRKDGALRNMGTGLSLTTKLHGDIIASGATSARVLTDWGGEVRGRELIAAGSGSDPLEIAMVLTADRLRDNVEAKRHRKQERKDRSARRWEHVEESLKARS